jgi:hypothetical protein
MNWLNRSMVSIGLWESYFLSRANATVNSTSISKTIWSSYIVKLALISIKEEYYRWQTEAVANDWPCIMDSTDLPYLDKGGSRRVSGAQMYSGWNRVIAVNTINTVPCVCSNPCTQYAT